MCNFNTSKDLFLLASKSQPQMEFEQLQVLVLLGSPGLRVLLVSPQDRFVPDHRLQEQTKKPHAKTAGQADKSVIPMVFMIYIYLFSMQGSIYYTQTYFNNDHKEDKKYCSHSSPNNSISTGLMDLLFPWWLCKTVNISKLKTRNIQFVQLSLHLTH